MTILAIIKIETMILGVSGWLSEKLGWETSLIRVGFVVLLLVFGTGLGLYIALWIVKLLSK